MLGPEQVLEIARRIANTNMRAWQNCHNLTSPERFDYIILVARECFENDNKVGCNWKRGVIGDLSMDAINYHGRIIDIVAGAGGSNPSLVWQDVTDAAPGLLANPFNLNLANEIGNPEPSPVPTPTPVPNNDLLVVLRDIREELTKLNRAYDWQTGSLFRHTAEVCTKLDILTNVIREK